MFLSFMPALVSIIMIIAPDVFAGSSEYENLMYRILCFVDSDYDDNSQDSWSYKHETDSSQRKSRQYFWQYNLQSKGPKGARVSFEQLEQDDPHVVKDFEDPVFDPVASKNVVGTTIRHGGKARRGDGTDVSPNPKKLYQIGQQINKLNKQIDSFIPLSEMPVSSRNKSKKEKNKLASR